jgi:hypothetical protein
MYNNPVQKSYKCSCFVCFGSVDGILSALEDRCLLTDSPVSIVAAAILGDKLRCLPVETTGHKLLTNEARVILQLLLLHINDD